MEEMSVILESLHKVREYCDKRNACGGCYFFGEYGCAFVDWRPDLWRFPNKDADNV